METLTEKLLDSDQKPQQIVPAVHDIIVGFDDRIVLHAYEGLFWHVRQPMRPGLGIEESVRYAVREKTGLETWKQRSLPPSADRPGHPEDTNTYTFNHRSFAGVNTQNIPQGTRLVSLSADQYEDAREQGKIPSYTNDMVEYCTAHLHWV